MPSLSLQTLSTQRVDLPITGMHCAGCAGRIQKALSQVPGVVEAGVNYATGRATVQFDGARVKPEMLVEKVEALGYGAELPADETERDIQREADAKDAADLREQRTLRNRFIIGAILSLPLVIVAMSHGAIGGDAAWARWLQFLLATPVFVYAGWPFHRVAVKSMLHGVAEMNTLISLGSSAAFFYSVVALLFPLLMAGSHAVGGDMAGMAHMQHSVPIYFEAAAVIITLVLLGRLFEARAKYQTHRAIRALVHLQPAMAHRVVNGVEQDVAVATVRVGHVLTMRPGEKVPADGMIIEGASAIEESMLTGESVPVEKTVGATVLAGTLNTNGAFQMQVTKVGSATALHQIVKLVEEAQGSKAPIAALADRVSAVFVPVVLGLAVVTFLSWFFLGPVDTRVADGLLSAVAVLIIACPCALGLATPTAVLVATGNSASHGVLINGGAPLQMLAELQMVVFDKTGTLTVGRPGVSEVRTLAAMTADEVLRLAASAEQRSEHPLARAIVEAAKEKALGVVVATKFLALPGNGVEAVVEGREILLGNAGLMLQRQVQVSAEAGNFVAAFAARGETPILVAVGGACVGVISLADAVKSGAAEAVQDLRAMELSVGMLTGDNVRTAEAVAKQLGITDVMAEVRPAEKAERVRTLQGEGSGRRFVGMVGDGINDGPALAAADVGMSMGSGTDLAKAASDVTLLRNDLNGIVLAVKVARKTMRVIRQNLFWAFAYNVVMVPLAAGALYPLFGWHFSPMWASAAMSLSSVTVVMNSLRLRRAL